MVDELGNPDPPKEQFFYNGEPYDFETEIPSMLEKHPKVKDRILFRYVTYAELKRRNKKPRRGNPNLPHPTGPRIHRPTFDEAMTARPEIFKGQLHRYVPWSGDPRDPEFIDGVKIIYMPVKRFNNLFMARRKPRYPPNRDQKLTRLERMLPDEIQYEKLPTGILDWDEEQVYKYMFSRIQQWHRERGEEWPSNPSLPVRTTRRSSSTSG